MANERLTQSRDFKSDQVSRLSLNETQRSNLANEAIRGEANRIASIDAATRAFSAQETQRSNLARESLQSQQNVETKRSNQARERLTHEANLEVNRSNRANERINSERNLLTKQANEETRRTNLANEGIRRQANANQQYANETGRLNYYVNMRNANTAVYNAETSRLSHYENVRSHQANEYNQSVANSIANDRNAIQQQFNAVSLGLQHRQQDMNYDIQRRQITNQSAANAINAYNAQTNRSNYYVNQQRVSNDLYLGIQNQNTQRYGIITGAKTQRAAQQTSRYISQQNIAQQRRELDERKRSNQVKERNETIKTIGGLVNTSIQTANSVFGNAAKLISLF